MVHGKVPFVADMASAVFLIGMVLVVDVPGEARSE
jgi:hypothetical protein